MSALYVVGEEGRSGRLVLSEVRRTDGKITSGYVVNGAWQWTQKSYPFVNMWEVGVPESVRKDMDYNEVLEWADKERAKCKSK